MSLLYAFIAFGSLLLLLSQDLLKKTSYSKHFENNFLFLLVFVLCAIQQILQEECDISITYWFISLRLHIQIYQVCQQQYYNVHS